MVVTFLSQLFLFQKSKEFYNQSYQVVFILQSIKNFNLQVEKPRKV
jgi:hypothetical protein